MGVVTYILSMNCTLLTVSGKFKYVLVFIYIFYNVSLQQQSCLPPDGKLLCFILYADKTTLIIWGRYGISHLCMVGDVS